MTKLAGTRRRTLLLLLFSLGLVLGAVLATGAAVLLPLGFALIWAVWRTPWALRRLLRWRTAFFLVVLLLSNALWWGGGEEIRFLPGTPSLEGLLVGLWMAARVLTILIAIGILTSTISVGEFTDMLRRTRWREQGFILGVAVNLLPLVQETLRNTLTALRLRGGFRHRRWRALQLLATSVITNLIQHADDIVCSAEARALGRWWEGN